LQSTLPLRGGTPKHILWSSPERIALSKPIISIIDDDGSVRAATHNLVRSLGYVVNTFASAEEFLQSPRLNDTSCVITDIRMPAMSGLDLQAHLLATGYSLPFIFVTAFSVESDRDRAMKAGATCFLSKPFDGETLIKCLEAALASNGRSAAR
jgi:FixJ family two-component response regulator